MSTLRATETHRASQSAWEVFLVFLRLGLTSFGGPIAHLGYFRDAFVTRRRWLSEHAYSDIVALCQFLPGPASSQVGMVVGLSRAGYPGALAAWVGFTLPSAIALILFALGLSHYGNLVPPSALHGLKVAAVAVVAQAVWGMARSLCPDAPRITLMILAAVAVTLIPSPWCQVGVMVVAGMVGAQRFRTAQVPPHEPLSIPVGHGAAIGFLLLFAGLLAGLPVVASMIPNHALALVDAFYRAGALVFGGGHVVLPLLQAAVVPTGWVDNDTFLAGYGATQAVPGPCSRSRRSSAQPVVPRRLAGSAASCACWRFSRRPSCWSLAPCRSGSGCAATRARVRRSRVSTRPWWACCCPRSISRSGPARSMPPPISRWHCSRWLR
jgi:chromate transporter